MLNIVTIELNRFQIINKISESQYKKTFLIECKETGMKYEANENKYQCTKKIEQNTFKNKIKVYYQTNFPTVMSFYGYSLCNYFSEPYPTIITEHAPHGSLKNIISQARSNQHPPEWTNTLRYIQILGIGLGMSFLHSKNIYLQNLNSETILLNENYYPLINIFAKSNIISKQIDHFASNSLSCNINNSKDDVYSFALLTYEIITLLEPQTNKRSPIEISKIKGEINQQFLSKCLSKEPSERPTFHDICHFIVRKEFLSLFDSIDYHEIFKFFELFNGHQEALFFQGIMFLEIKNQSNENEISYIIKKFIEKENPEMIENDVFMINKEEEEMTNYFKIIAEKGDPEIMYDFAVMLDRGDGI